MIFVIDQGIKSGSSRAISLIYIVISNLKNLVDEILSNSMHQNMAYSFLCRILFMSYAPYEMIYIIWILNGEFYVIEKWLPIYSSKGIHLSHSNRFLLSSSWWMLFWNQSRVPICIWDHSNCNNAHRSHQWPKDKGVATCNLSFVLAT